MYLFGSRARRDYQQGTDIDFALDTGFAIDLSAFLRLYNEIENITIRLTVDLVDLHTASLNCHYSQEIKFQSREFVIALEPNKPLWN